MRLVPGLLILFGDEDRDPSTTRDQARAFFEASFSDFNPAALIASFPSDDAWPLTETWQIWDLASQPFIQSAETGMIIGALEVLDGEPPVDLGRVRTFALVSLATSFLPSLHGHRTLKPSLIPRKRLLRCWKDSGKEPTKCQSRRTGKSSKICKRLTFRSFRFS